MAQIRLDIISNAGAGTREAANARQEYERLGNAIDRAGDEARETQRQIRGVGTALSNIASAAGRAIGVVGGLVGAAATLGSIRLSASFERQIATVGVVAGATRDQFNALERAAREAGATTERTATEAASGLEFLARAGFDANEAITALIPTINFAIANQIDLGRAADIGSNVLSQFSLQVDNYNRVVDVLTQTSASANTNVLQVSEGFKFAGPTAAQLAIDLEETAAALGVLANTGLQGGIGGRGFQSVVTRLESEREDLEAAIGAYDIQVDGLAEIFRRVGELDTVTQIEIFRAENLDVVGSLSRAASSGEFEQLLDRLREAEGRAQEVAGVIGDTLTGDALEANSAFQDLLNTIGDSGGIEGTRNLLQEITALLRSDASIVFSQNFGQALEAATNLLAAFASRTEEFFDNLRQQGIINTNVLADVNPLANITNESIRSQDLSRNQIGVLASSNTVATLERRIEELNFAVDRNNELLRPGSEFQNDLPLLNERAANRQELENLIAALAIAEVTQQSERESAEPPPPLIQPAPPPPAREVVIDTESVQDDLAEAGRALALRVAEAIEDSRRDAIPIRSTDDLDREIERINRDSRRVEDLISDQLAQDRINGDIFNDQLAVAQEGFSNQLGSLTGIREVLERQDNRLTLRDVEISARAIEQITSGIQFGLSEVTEALTLDGLSVIDRVAGATGGIGRSLTAVSDGIRALPEGVSRALGGLGDILGAAGAVGSAISAGINIVSQISDLFGPTSREGVNVVFAPGVEDSETFGQRRNNQESDANRAIVESIFAAISQQQTALFDLIGGGAAVRDNLSTAISEAFLNINVDNRDIRVGFQGTDGNPANPAIFDPTNQGAERAIEEAIRLILSVTEVFDESSQTLLTYAQVAAEAGRAPDQIIEGLRSLSELAALADEPLSEVAERIRIIDETIDPVVDDLIALRDAISGAGAGAAAQRNEINGQIGDIEQTAQQAGRNIGIDFVRGIEQAILDEQQSVLGDYNRLLEQIAQTQADAQLLLDRGFISQGEFEQTQGLGALQAANFFDRLDAEQLAELGDFFGLLNDDIGSGLAALAELQVGIIDFADNIEETSARLQREADAILGAVSNGETDLERARRQFTGDLPSEQIDALLGNLAAINETVRDPNADSELVTDRVNVARDIFSELLDIASSTLGPTEEFAEIRDQAFSVFESILSEGRDRGEERISLIDASNAQLSIVEQIRDEILSPDPSLNFLQGILDNNDLTNTLLRELIAVYISTASDVFTLPSGGAIQDQVQGLIDLGGGASLFDVVQNIQDQRTDQSDLQRQQTAQLIQIESILSNTNTRIDELVDLTRSGR